MTKVIEIVVIGGVGSGKSHVLALIDKALRDSYGPHTQVACREISLEIGLGKPSPRPSDDTIFSLKEQCGEPGKAAGDYYKEAMASGSVSVEALKGCVTGYAINPLESAIDQTVRLIGEECDKCRELASAGQPSGRLVEVLGAHLDALLALQLRTLKDDAGLGGSDAPKFEPSLRGDSGPELEMTGPSRVLAPGKAAIEIRQYMDEVILSLKSINAAAEAAAKAARAQEASGVRIA